MAKMQDADLHKTLWLHDEQNYTMQVFVWVSYYGHWELILLPDVFHVFLHGVRNLYFICVKPVLLVNFKLLMQNQLLNNEHGFQ